MNRSPLVVPWKGAHSHLVPCLKMETERSTTITINSKITLSNAYCSPSFLFYLLPRGRKTISAVQWMRSWSSANATVPLCTSDIQTRTIGQSARFWGSGGTLWGPMRSSSTTILPSRFGFYYLLLICSKFLQSTNIDENKYQFLSLTITDIKRECN